MTPILSRSSQNFGFGRIKKLSIPCPDLGSFYEGGYLISQSGGIRWIVAPSSSEVIRTWYSQGDAATTAQQVSGCTGWFVPNASQLQNPGYSNRGYWDSYSIAAYWSSTQYNEGDGCGINMGNGQAIGNNKDGQCRVRAFRQVTY